MIRVCLHNATVCAEHTAVAKLWYNHNGEASEPMIVTLSWAFLSEQAEHTLNKREVESRRKLFFTTTTWMLLMVAIEYLLLFFAIAVELTYGDDEAPNQFPK